MVILDDVLSGLDADTENRVFHSLLGRHGLLRKQCATVLMTSSSGTWPTLPVLTIIPQSIY
jgi:ATP-binding cassette subfamily C (CFTR/MRP) protein 1